MKNKNYLTELGKKSAIRLNQITMAVNARADIDLKDNVEKQYHSNLMKEAKAHKKKYGEWPVFEMQEIESDDPALDIYSGPV